MSPPKPGDLQKGAAPTWSSWLHRFPESWIRQWRVRGQERAFCSLPKLRPANESKLPAQTFV